VIHVLDARFVITAVEPKGYPSADVPEIAFVGRSNVGKSSMINTLAQRRKLVRVSNTPGRTRTLNFFDVDLELGKQRRTVRLADLPGYGFAKASKAERTAWEKMITRYLTERASLKAVVAIVDGEVGPSGDDAKMIDYLLDAERQILVVATKIDRIAKAHRKPRLREISEALEVPAETVLAFSAKEPIGHDEVWETLLDVTYPRGPKGR
jgi:GTP-binding protein